MDKVALRGFKTKTCPKCDGTEFYIFFRNKCEDCPFNGAYDPDKKEYIYDEQEVQSKRLKRDESFEDGQCAFGDNYDAGCEIFRCVKCGHEWFIPYVSGA